MAREMQAQQEVLGKSPLELASKHGVVPPMRGRDMIDLHPIAEKRYDCFTNHRVQKISTRNYGFQKISTCNHEDIQMHVALWITLN